MLEVDTQLTVEEPRELVDNRDRTIWSDRMWITFRNGGVFAGLVFAVEHSYVTQFLGALLAFATVFWTEWVREHFRRLRENRRPRRTRRRKTKVKEAV